MIIIIIKSVVESMRERNSSESPFTHNVNLIIAIISIAKQIRRFGDAAHCDPLRHREKLSLLTLYSGFWKLEIRSFRATPGGVR